MSNKKGTSVIFIHCLGCKTNLPDENESVAVPAGLLPGFDTVELRTSQERQGIDKVEHMSRMSMTSSIDLLILVAMSLRRESVVDRRNREVSPRNQRGHQSCPDIALVLCLGEGMISDDNMSIRKGRN
jgi:hypothetical protein